MTSISGWLFDAYASGDKMVFWVKREDGRTIKLQDNWSHSIYVACNDRQDLAQLAKDSAVKSHEFVQKYEKVTDTAKSEVLKLTLADSAQAEALAKRIMLGGRYGEYRLYNVDLLPAQAYFYEHDLFPLAFCNVAASRGKLLSCADDVWSIDYKLPKFKAIHLSVKPKKQGKLPKFLDSIESITIKSGEEVLEIDASDEVQGLFRLNEGIQSLDPDIVFTKDGDAFVFPYLAHRAKINDCQQLLALGRDSERLTRKPGKDGTTYFSYGRIHYRPSSAQLYGRVHIDTYNSFILDESGMQGLYEVARICRMPLHKASRASIGRCMSSLQCYYATINDILIPWKPDHAEHFKTYSELFVADRGGMIFEPRVGVHEQVAEFDFASLYPSIMSQKNLSGETVLCSCCPDSRLRVPELGWHICEKKRGIVPTSLEILLKKRALYKQRLKSPDTPAEQKKIVDARQTALKWILVTSFGYLGFNNAKFGRIDAHIATCAFDRQVLLQAVRVAEARGFRVLHGIIDSLWVYRKGATRQDFLALKDAIEQATGFTISFEGVYKWVAFLHSKQNVLVPVPNQYFGVFEDGTLKVRGIEIRRRDNPPFFDKVQAEVLNTIAAANSAAEVRALQPAIQEIFNKYALQLKEEKVPLEDLVIARHTSKDANHYSVNTAEINAIQQLAKEGKSLRAGEVLHYVFAESSKEIQRAVPVELINAQTRYDVTKYIELLIGVFNSLTEPFDYTFRLIEKPFCSDQKLLHSHDPKASHQL